MEFRNIIIEWYRQNHRSLPWRQTKDPYKIWVSEVILQQTRVKQGLSYYHRFLERFPDVQALARASEDQVLKVWQGLGYYSRARNMHQAAKTVVKKYQGRFPDDFNEIIELKGIGEYTASALASIAFDLPFPVIDGNVLRLMARLKGITEPVDGTEGRKIIKEILAREIVRVDPGTFNQALMEFGALVCTPKSPACMQCPLQVECVARNTGDVDKIPIKEKKAPVRPRYFHYLVILLKEDNQVFTFLKQRSGKDIWKKLYEFPMIEANTYLDWQGLMQEPGYKEIIPGKAPGLIGASPEFRHVLSHRVLHARYFLIEGTRLQGKYIKVKWEKLNDFPVSKLMVRMMEHINITFYE